MTTSPAPCLSTRAAIAEQLLGEVHWHSDTSGFCRCPGEAHHTTPSGRRDCRVMLDGAPTLHCFHTSCADALASVNYELRASIAKAEMSGHEPPVSAAVRRERKRQRREAEQKREKEEALARRAATALPEILVRYAWDHAHVWEASAIRLEGPPADDWRLLLGCLYPADAVLWTGEKHQSGKPRHARRFRTVRDWLIVGEAPAPLICPAIFKTGSCSRCDADVIARPYLVLDGDSVDSVCAAKLARKEKLTPEDMERNRAACLAVFNWLRLETDLQLRAIADSGAKSAHGWFEYPDAAALDDLRLTMRALGLDKATLGASQPVRLPGVRRAETGRWQKLLYLNPKTKIP